MRGRLEPSVRVRPSCSEMPRHIVGDADNGCGLGMAVGLEPPSNLLPVGGIRLAATHCGIKPTGTNRDLALIEIVDGATVAGVFTQSHFAAAPVEICRRHLAERPGARYLLINSGNANAATGETGFAAALECCRVVADSAGVVREDVLPFSTGVIAEALPLEPIVNAVPVLLQRLDAGAWLDAAEGIMTTDTLPKAVSRRVQVEGKPVTITGMAKGSGMIKPDMATMLAYVATDAMIDSAAINDLLREMVDDSFNSITVDGDTSTNDSCLLIATGTSGIATASSDLFVDALREVFVELAQAIIRDAEGASKFVEIEVQGAASHDDARAIAFTIAESPLVKTALFASDPNWGRLIMAIGRAPVARIEIDRIDLFLGPVRLLHEGLPDPDYREELGQSAMNGAEINIRVNMNLGEHNARVWTSDLSYDYVKINAEYRS